MNIYKHYRSLGSADNQKDQSTDDILRDIILRDVVGTDIEEAGDSGLLRKVTLWVDKHIIQNPEDQWWYVSYNPLNPMSDDKTSLKDVVTDLPLTRLFKYTEVGEKSDDQGKIELSLIRMEPFSDEELSQLDIGIPVEAPSISEWLSSFDSDEYIITITRTALISAVAHWIASQDQPKPWLGYLYQEPIHLFAISKKAITDPCVPNVENSPILQGHPDNHLCKHIRPTEPVLPKEIDCVCPDQRFLYFIYGFGAAVGVFFITTLIQELMTKRKQTGRSGKTR